MFKIFKTTIQNKIFLGVFVVVVFSTIASFISYNRTRQIEGFIRDVIPYNQQVVYLHDLSVAIYGLESSVDECLLAGCGASGEETVKDMERVFSVFGLLKEVSDDEFLIKLRRVEQIFHELEANVGLLAGGGEAPVQGGFDELAASIHEQIEIAREVHFSLLSEATERVGDNAKVQLAAIISLNNTLIFLSLLTLVIGFFGAILLARSISRPIVALRKSVSRIKRGDLSAQARITSNDEIGELANAFNRMLSEIKESRREIEEYSQNLEEQVSGKTAELQELLKRSNKDKKELEAQRSATLNILEDVSDSQKQLEEANRKLSQRSAELESIKKLSDDLTSVLDVEQAVETINRYISGILEFDAVTYLLVNPVRDGGFVYSTFLKNPVSEQFLAVSQKDLFKFLDKEEDEEISSVKKVVKNIKPHIYGARPDNSRKDKIVSKMLLPLRMGGYTLGVIQVCSSRSGLAGKRGGRGLTDAMLATFSLSVARLHTLIRSQHSKTISLVESLSDGIVMFNNDKNIVLTNPAIEDFTGLQRDSFNLDIFDKLFAGVEIVRIVNETLNSGTVSQINEVQFANKIYELFITPVKDSQDKIVGGAVIMHDITHLKEVDKMKTEFVSVASHQLRTPLTAIKLFTEMLLSEQVGGIKREQKDYLTNIYQSTERMVRLVNDLLSLSRLESGRLRVEPEPTDIVDFIDNIISEILPLAQTRSVKVDFKKSGVKLPKVPLDPNLMRQVIHNLITNAVRYSAGRRGAVEVGVSREGGEFLVKVKDSGIGIPKKVQSRIFEKFFRADNAIKSETEGTGLGLYVSKMIVESSGGRIWFDSKENEGTVFFVTIPVKGMPKKEGTKTLAGSQNELSYS